MGNVLPGKKYLTGKINEEVEAFCMQISDNGKTLIFLVT